MQMPSPITSADFRKPDPLREQIEAAFPMPRGSQSLAGPNISLGYLDTINKRSIEPLMSAIQNAESGLNAQEAERRGMVNQGMQQGYAAETNARNQLVAKSNELSGKINEIESSYDYRNEPERYQDLIDNLLAQKSEVDGQLEQSTAAIMANPNYGGETLVNPVSAKRQYNSEQRKSMGAAANEFLTSELRKLSPSELIDTNSTDYIKKLKESNKDISLTDSDLRSFFDARKKELVSNNENSMKFKIDMLDFVKAYRDDKANLKEHENKMISLATEFLKNNAELTSMTQDYNTAQDFIKATENMPIIGDIAKSSGIEGSIIKSALLQFFNSSRQPKDIVPADAW